MRAERRGAALIEVLAAVLLLGFAGVGLVTLLSQTSRAMQLAAASEAEQNRASQEARRLVLLDRHDLDWLRGENRARDLVIRITDREEGLFDITIATLANHTLLTTTLYRPDSADVTP